MLDNEDRKEARAAVWYVGRWVLLGVIVIGVIGAAIWAIGVATSDVAGRGNQTRQINDATNRTFQYEHFHDLNAAVIAYDDNVNVQASLKKSDYNEQVLAGIEMECNRTVQQYNADARKFTRNKFLDAELPVALGEDQATDCKEDV